MSLEIVFPKNIGQRYYDIHYKFVLNLFKGSHVTFDNFFEDGFNEIIIEINGKICLINFSDFGRETTLGGDLFKMHFKDSDRGYPFTPVSFYDWDWYERIGKFLKYKAEGFISSRQRAYAGAKERRDYVQRLLANYCGPLDYIPLFHMVDQKRYFNEVEDILVAVCVPGANNNMLDRGQLQYMGLGACTISPLLPEILPFNKQLIPMEHYICCQDDYADLEDWINYCKDHQSECIEIGMNAKKLFQETCTPNAVEKWVKECLQL